jgi:hypothetical protein
MMKSMRKAITKSMRNAMRTVKSLTKSATKSVRKVTRKVARKVKTRRSKRHAMKGGDYETSIVRNKLELVPILADESPELSVSVPGFGTIGMKAYRQYMQDLDTRGPRQM